MSLNLCKNFFLLVLQECFVSHWYSVKPTAYCVLCADAVGMLWSQRATRLPDEHVVQPDASHRRPVRALLVLCHARQYRVAAGACQGTQMPARGPSLSP